MWECPRCGRVFKSKGQVHSCSSIPLEKHFENKEKAKKLFNHLINKIEKDIGKIKIISIPCCVHLFSNYDFLAALPKKDCLEIRFASDNKIESPRLKIAVPISAKSYKNCFEIKSEKEFDKEFMGWIRQSYFLKANLNS